MFLITCHLAFAQQVVEEVVAVVDTTPLLASDVTLASLVRLLSADPHESEAAYRSRLLGARIRLELQYRDLEESGALYRLAVDPDSVRADMVKRAGGEQTLAAGLTAAGLTSADVDQLALRVAAAAAYTEQRLRPRVSISLDEIEQAYQDEVVQTLKAEGKPAPPLPEVRELLHRLLLERKLNAEIERWLEAAGERHEVTRYVP
jgi:hypothetical protein